MKSLTFWTLLILLSFGLTLSEGCRKVAAPTFPVILTSTMTSTPVNTGTSTSTMTQTPIPPTSTATNSRTATPSVTQTPTVTSTATATNTGAFTSTSTTTPTITNTTTITNTPTPTSTSGGCPPASVQTTYTFESSLDCWQIDVASTVVTGISLSSTQAYEGSQSMAIAINNTTAGNQNAQVQVVFAGPQNMAGGIISMWVYVEGTLKTLADWQTAAQPFAQDPWFGNWQALGPQVPVNTWTNIPVTITGTGTAIAQFGLQLTTVGPGAAGNVYIDGVTINLAPPPTPTLTPTPAPVATWDFEDNTQQGWLPAGGNLAGTTHSLTAPGWNASAYCFDLLAPFTGINQTAGIAQSLGAPLDLTGGGIRCYVWLDAGVSDGYPGGQIMPSDGTNTYYGFWSNLTQGGWALLDSPASTWTGVNAANITQIIIQAATGGTGTTFAGGHVKIDQIEAY